MSWLERAKRLRDSGVAIFGSSHFLLEIPFVSCSQWVRVCFGPCVCLSRSRRLSFSCAGVVLAALAGMVSDGFQTQKGFVDPG